MAAEKVTASYRAVVPNEYVTLTFDEAGVIGRAVVEKTYMENGKPYAVIYFKNHDIRMTFPNDGTKLISTGQVVGQEFGAGRRKSRRHRTRRSRRRTTK